MLASPPAAWTDEEGAYLRFFVRGVPNAQGSKIGGIGRRGDGSQYAYVRDTNPLALKTWRGDVKQAAVLEMAGALPAPRDLAIGIELTFFLPRPQSQTLRERRQMMHRRQPDSDKLERAVFDALTAVVWTDDSQVAEVHKKKLFAGDQPPGCEIRVWVAER